MENATLIQFMNATNIFGHNFGHKRLEKIFAKYGNNFLKFMKEHNKEDNNEIKEMQWENAPKRLQKIWLNNNQIQEMRDFKLL